ncbi:hypothetical protein BJV78DRAFT_1280002 [Lactifluus subvellereus]|nr:hypothetical protein BJV78DRAFT_1280002 [Lactifluus subvellereus]
MAGPDGLEKAGAEPNSGDLFQDTLLAQLDGSRAVGLWQQKQKFFPAPAGETIGGAQRRPEGVGKTAQRDVAGMVAEAVIDVFEMIDIEQGNRKGLLATVAAEVFMIEQFVHGAAIEQPRQFIIGREMTNFPQGPLQFGFLLSQPSPQTLKAGSDEGAAAQNRHDHREIGDVQPGALSGRRMQDDIEDGATESEEGEKRNRADLLDREAEHAEQDGRHGATPSPART